jgi:hypothetical protein
MAEKKKYHESKRKMGEARRSHAKTGGDAMFHAESGMSGYYEGDMSRRTQEMQDAGMIREDRSNVSNLPHEVMFKPYEMVRNYMKEGIDDTIRGVDGQMNMDDRKRNETFKPKKV